MSDDQSALKQLYKKPFLGLIAVLLLLTGAANSQAQTPAFKKFPFPQKTGPGGYLIETAISEIVTGADNNLWYVVSEPSDNHRIGRITPSGIVNEYPVLGYPTSITVGPSGSLFFGVGIVNSMGQHNPLTGTTSYYSVGTSCGSGPDPIVSAYSTLWFKRAATCSFPYTITRMSASGTIYADYSIPVPYSAVNELTAGPDGNFWYVAVDVRTGTGATGERAIVRMTPSGLTTKFPFSSNIHINDIISGPDAALWLHYTEGTTSVTGAKIARMNTAGAVTTTYDFPSNLIRRGRMVFGPDGAIWSVNSDYTGHGVLARITTNGDVLTYLFPELYTNPYDLTVGPDGALWVGASNAIWRVAIVPPTVDAVELAMQPLGTSYGLTLSASGGTPPYSNWTMSSGSLPPGLSLNGSTGLISGILTTPGTFTFYITVKDSLGITSAPQQFSLTVTSVGCSYSLSPNTQNFPASGGIWVITITGSASCTWSVVGLPNWVIPSSTSGTGPGTLTLTVLANTGPARSSTFTVGGNSATINQEAGAGCTYGLDPGSRNFAASGGIWTIFISTSSTCSWSVSGQPSWISVSGSPSGTTRVQINGGWG